MKTKIILSLFLCVSMLFACQKDNTQPTPAPTTGSLYFQNTQKDPYTIYLDGASVGVLSAGTTSSVYTTSSGITHTVKATQFSGYALYPTVFTGTATLNPGGTITWSF